MESVKHAIIKSQQLTLIPKAKNWVTQQLPGRLIFTTPKRATVGWHRVTIKALNAEARHLLKELTLTATQNRQLSSIPLLSEGLHTQSLVFYRHHPLNQLILDYTTTNNNIQARQAQFSVTLKAITSAKAWLLMLSSVAKKQAEQGIPKNRIYRLSRARQKRAGYKHALKKLVQEYQPLLSHQLVTCEPYEYWRLYREPALMEQKTSPYAGNLVFLSPSSDLPKNIEDNQWFGIRRKQVEDSRYFKATLAEVARGADEEVDILYWDHDYLDNEQERVAPEFKPDWNPDYFASRNYIAGCFCVRGRLLKQLNVNNWCSLDSYQQLLHLLVLMGDKHRNSIKHIDKVLQHLPLPETHSSASVEQVKQQRSLLSQWLVQQDKIDVNIESAVEEGVNKVNYCLQSEPKVTLIVPTRDSLEITKNCINSVLTKTDYSNYNILIIDNQSEDPATLAWFEDINENSRVTVLQYDAPFNYSAINNFAATKAEAELLCFLNNDTEVINSGWLREMVQHAARPSIGCVGAKLYFPDDTVQHAGVVMGIWGLAGHSHKFYNRYAQGNSQRLQCVQNYSAVTAACLIVKKTLFEAVGGFNESDLTVAFNDVDLCLKVDEKGLRNLWTPYAELYHYESKSRGKDTTPTKKAREQKEIEYMQKKWAGIIDHDPAYNANLTRIQESFDINLSHKE